MLNRENPTTTEVKQSSRVFQRTFPFLRVENKPQKQRPRTAAMNSAAPRL